MPINKNELKIETIRGKGPGGQHRNKTDSMVRITHIPTGIVVSVDGRHQHKNRKAALEELEKRIRELRLQRKAAQKKAYRDAKIHDHTIVRTYDYSRGVVKDHKTRKTASLKNILDKGRLELLHGDTIPQTRDHTQETSTEHGPTKQPTNGF
jgi:protein subunit release factor A